MKKIILASASPRRKELLEKIGLKFEVDSAFSDEALRPDVPPHELARQLSLAKAMIVSERHPDTIVIAADTFGVLEGKLLGKPRDAAEARQMLGQLSGKSHKVITGLTVVDTGEKKTVSRSVETIVHFRKLTEAEIDAYVATGEPLDKAAAYAIQGKGSVLIKKIEGDFYNVIGLPLSMLSMILKEYGINIMQVQ